MPRRPPSREAARRFVLNPQLVITEQGREIRIENPSHGNTIQSGRELRRVLDFFSRSRTLRELQRAVPTGDDLLEILFDNFILLAEEEAPFLARGFVRESPIPVGRSCAWSELRTQAAEGSVALFGVPSDAGALADTGTREGPEWIRRALRSAGPWSQEAGSVVLDFDLRRRYDVSRLSVFDLGDIELIPGEALDLAGARIGKLIRSLMDQRLMPVMLGGDHSLTWYALRELLARHSALGILHFDAHSDLYSVRYDFGDMLTHANAFTFARRSPSLRTLRQIGLRGLECPIKGTKEDPDRRVQFITAREVREHGPRSAFAALPRNIPYYLSFDVDCIDPTLAPETGAPRMGGLTLHEAVELIDYATRRFDIVAADFMEVGAPVLPQRHDAADATARCIAALLLARMPSVPLKSHIYSGAGRHG